MKPVKFFIVFLFILSFILLGFAVTVFLGKRSEELRRIQTEEQLDIQKSENKKLSLAYEELGGQNQKLAGEIKQAEEKLTAERTRAEEMVKALDQEKTGKGRLEEAFNQLKTDYQKLSQELEIMQQKYQDSSSRIATGTNAPQPLKTEIELPPVIVRSGAPGTGKVLVLNRDFNFIVVDMGVQEGLAKGEFLFVTRASKPVARVQAEKVYDHFSACAIVEESKTSSLREGDSVSKS
jgi:predicted RNase H-like nuclease (RuvC/YqgF family)